MAKDFGNNPESGDYFSVLVWSQNKVNLSSHYSNNLSQIVTYDQIILCSQYLKNFFSPQILWRHNRKAKVWCSESSNGWGRKAILVFSLLSFDLETSQWDVCSVLLLISAWKLVGEERNVTGKDGRGLSRVMFLLSHLAPHLLAHQKLVLMLFHLGASVNFKSKKGTPH